MQKYYYQSRYMQIQHCVITVCGHFGPWSV